MRMKLAKSCVGLVLALVLLAPGVKAQNPEIWDPEKSAAKAKQLLQQAIEALGGAAFRDYTDVECEGRLAEFDHNGDRAGDANYHNYWHFPDKNRTEYVVNSTKGGPLAVFVGILPIKGGVFIQVFSGSEGWTLDKSGVNEAAAGAVSNFQEAAKNHFRNVLLLKVNEPDVFLRYTGTTAVDLWQVDWVEITNRGEEGSIRVALDHATHLPSRVVVTSKDADTGQMDEDVTILTNYQPNDGVQIPMQVNRLHNDRRTYQLFYNSCKVSPKLPADFFTKEGLERRYKESKGKVTDKK
ncbi:MAG TPA: hypothetical protein VN830_06355 [Verrucomicrobiae bacterium]|nr:hypothetical protein [Verrucomicrobiae bacterium]